MGCLPFNSLGGQSDISIHTSVKEAAGNVPGKGSPPYMKVYAAHKKCANSACAFAATAWSSPSGRQNVCNTNLLYGLSFFVYAVL